MKEAKSKLENLGKKVLKDIDRGENPNIDIPIRTLSNVRYDPKTGMLTLGEKSAKRFFFHTAHAKKFMQTLAMASFCKELLKENIHTSIRDAFYALKKTLPNSNENIFEDQRESDPIIIDLEVALDVLREQLHLAADVRGKLVGDLVIVDRGDRIDCSKMGSGGWGIPSVVEDIEFKKVHADFILCLPEYEEIVVKEDGLIQSKNISEVFKDYQSGKEIYVIGFDENFNPKFNKIYRMIKREARENEKLIKIESSSGSSIYVSEDHKIPLLTKNGVVNFFAKFLEQGMYLLEAKDLSPLANSFRNFEFDLIGFILKFFPEKINEVRVYGKYVKSLLEDVRMDWWYKQKEGLYQELINSWKKLGSIPLAYYIKFERDRRKRKEVKLYMKGAPRKSAIPAVINFDKKLAKLLGYFVAEGHVYNSLPFWTVGKHEGEIKNEIISLITNIFEIQPRVYKEDGSYSSVQIMCGNKVAGLFFEFFCGKGCYEKKVPFILFNMDDEIKRSFLEGYIKGDGYVYDNLITCSTVSKKLAKEVRLLLRFMGIPSYENIVKNDKGFGRNNFLSVIGILAQHWESKNLTTSRSLWDKAPIFLFSGGSVKTKKRLGYAHLNIYASTCRMNLAYVHPVKLRKIETVAYNGYYYEIVSAIPTHTILHTGGIFSHNCVEKNACYERLNEDKFWKKHNCLLITSQGQAARGVRRLIQRLSIEYNLPVYTLTDANSWGWYIHSVIKYGSISLAHVSDRLGVINAKFIGMTISDIERFKLEKFTQKATEVDIKRAKEMLKYEWFKHPAWQRELNLLIQKKIKAEIEALSGRGLRFITEEYLPTKIENQEFLP